MLRLHVLSKQIQLAAGDADNEVLFKQNTAARDSEELGPACWPPVTDRSSYESLYSWSVRDPVGFWANMARAFYWHHPFLTDHHSANLDVMKGPIHVEWFKGGRTNLSYNCLDRWVAAGRGNQVAFIWEGNDPGHERSMTYQQTLDEVCRVANWLKAQGVRKGDCVAIYLPMICELPIAMLACARIGAVHSVVFGGFSAESLAQRVLDCKAKVVITATGVMRGTKLVELKATVDAALEQATSAGYSVGRVLVWEKSAVPRAQTPWVSGRDAWWRDGVPRCAETCAPEWVDAEDPLFLLYTSGSTGKPKGVLHTTGGYMVSAAVTSHYSLGIRPGDVYWCTADCGWVTGHTYITYGPLLCGACNVLFGSTPTHPDPSRCWRIVEKYRVKQLYTSPTLIRSLLQHPDHWVRKHDLTSLQLLGTVGEPIGPAAWNWFNEVIGGGRCPIVDSWWQTETGSMLITPMAGAWPLQPGSATLPFFGVQPALLDPAGHELEGPAEGLLVIKAAWPSMMRTIYGDHLRFEETYFSPYKGYYFTGDGCRRDGDGYYWVTGRVDDVLNVSGHRVGTAEVEGALGGHPAVAEAAVVGVEHAIKGLSIYAFVTLKDGQAHDAKTKKELLQRVRSEIGAFAAPDVIHWAPGLPKTRSGKIMRRMLRKIASGQEAELGDTTTLADPGVIQQLLDMRGK